MTSLFLATVVTAVPFAAFVLGLVFLRRRPGWAAAITILGGVASTVAALALLARGPHESPIVAPWFTTGGTAVRFGYLLDGPNLLMGALVAFVALAVQVYSVAYMSGDREKGRYFALLALFAWSMLSLVYAANLLQLFIFWELVGLASFLLIGFWYERPPAAAAARKAFLMTRVGDVGFLIGLVLLFHEARTLDIAEILRPATLQALPPETATLIGFLLVLGVFGKSAQFPLHTWLPDAMEGPTPVSALLHSATMVAAGVYLFARFLPLFHASEAVVTFVFVIAVLTAILSATVALVTRDMKRILAYSSISQLSFMLLGLAAGSLYAGLFHLVTHAFFKALLFLCAGAYIHAFGTNDLVTMGRRGARRMRWTTTGLVAGSAALAGLPVFAGFFSKEAILHAVGTSAGPFVLVATYLAAFLTAYYTFRMVFLVLRPNPASALADAPADPAAHAHRGEAPWLMRGPVLVLTALTVIAGFLGRSISTLIASSASGLDAAHGTLHEAGRIALIEAAPAVLVALAGVALAWAEFGRRGADQRGVAERASGIERFFANGWYVDRFYDRVIARLVALVSRFSAAVENRALDASGDGVGSLTVRSGFATAKLQSGKLQAYIGAAVVMIAALCVALVAS